MHTTCSSNLQLKGDGLLAATVQRCREDVRFVDVARDQLVVLQNVGPQSDFVLTLPHRDEQESRDVGRPTCRAGLRSGRLQPLVDAQCEPLSRGLVIR